MELFFLLSGMGTYFSLRSRPVKAYLWGRTKRLLIPLYSIGVLVLLPPQYYFERVTHHGFSGNVFALLPHYWDGFNLPRLTPWPDSLIPLSFSGHLWFLQYLFLITVFMTPVLLWFNTQSGQDTADRMVRWLDRPGGIFLVVIPLAIPLIALRGMFEVPRGWADLAWYAVYYGIGFILASKPQFSERINQQGWLGLPLWFLGFLGLGCLVWGLQYNPFPGAESYSLTYGLYQVVWATMSWSSIVFLLYLGNRFLRRKFRGHAYLSEAVLPFYLLHQTVILCLGSLILEWDSGMAVKLAAVAILSLASIVTVYHILIRRFNALRILFGMPVQKRQPAPT
jgi:hypothetical protein